MLQIAYSLDLGKEPECRWDRLRVFFDSRANASVLTRDVCQELYVRLCWLELDGCADIQDRARICSHAYINPIAEFDLPLSKAL